MNLIFRLVAICIGYLFERKRQNVLDTSKIPFRVWPLDLDMNIHMNNGRYLSIMDLGRLDLLVRLGIMTLVIKNKWMPVLAAAQIRYRVQLHPFEKFRLHTNIVWWDEKWFYIEQRFLCTRGKRDDVVAAIAVVKGSFYCKAEKRTVPTDTLIDLIGAHDVARPERPKFIKEWQEAEEEMRLLTAEDTD